MRGATEEPGVGAAGGGATLTTPGATAIGGRQDQAEIADGPAAVLIDEREAADRQRLAGVGGLPGAAAVAGVQHARAGRAGDPAVRAAHREGRVVELRVRTRGNFARGRLPGLAEIGGGEHEAAIADQPAAGRGDELHAIECAQAKVGGLRFDRAAANRGHEAVAAGERAHVRIDEVGGEPGARGAAGDGRPAAAGVAGDIDVRQETAPSSGRRPSRCASRKSRSGEWPAKCDRAGSSSLAAVARLQHDADAGVRVRLQSSAGGPADLVVQKEHAREPAVDAGGLLFPVLAAIGRVPDGAAIADGPAALRADERHVGELRVGEHRGRLHRLDGECAGGQRATPPRRRRDGC